MSSVMRFMTGVPRVLICRSEVRIVEGGGCFDLSLLGDIDSVVGWGAGEGSGVEVPAPAPPASASTTAPARRIVLFKNAEYDVGSAKEEEEEEEQGVLREGCTCDACSRVIESDEPVFVCDTCFGYDLCRGCVKKAAELHDPAHAFHEET
jgi:hypothetical protein